jgi:hypothetical protein
VQGGGNYLNSSIADIAMSYAGKWGGEACKDAGRSGWTGTTDDSVDRRSSGQPGDGQCRAFVNCIV